MCTFGALFSLAAAESDLPEVAMWQIRFTDASSFSTKEICTYFEYGGTVDPIPLILRANCEKPDHTLQFPKDENHPIFKIRFMLQPPQESALPPNDHVGHEIGFCELNLSDLARSMQEHEEEDEEQQQQPLVQSHDVYDSTDTVVGFVGLEVTSFYAKTDDEDGRLHPTSVLFC